jgi:hypothetical protein
MIELDLTLYTEVLDLQEEVRKNLVNDINACIESGNIADVTRHPRYQTQPNLFDQTKEHWKHIKEAITKKVSKHFDVNNSEIRAWAYIKYGREPEDSSTSVWHSHKRDNGICNAIFYLDVPESSSTTEFMDKDGNVYRPKLVNQLLIIHDSSTVHRPPLWIDRKPNENRYVIAVEYYSKKVTMNTFTDKGYVLVKGFLDPDSVSVVSRYLENALRRYPENNQGGGQGDSSKISYYADPLIEMILADKLAHVEEVTGFKLFPSYSFTRVYQKGEELKAHIDRPGCEISLTCHIATVGKPWPIWMQTPGGEPTEYTLEPGDACVYKGCEIKHWREPATDTDINVQMMLHYVNQNGPNADHKFDRRPGLSLRK